MDLLPPNATQQERAIAETIGRVSDVPVLLRDLWNPQTCPANLLPWLAWGMSVDEWNPDWSEQQKRDLIAASVDIHRKKGTIGAVKAVARSFNRNILIKEWWQETPAGVPHTFRITLSTGSASIEVQSSVQKAIEQVKPVRSYMIVDQFSNEFLSPLNVFTTATITMFRRETSTIAYVP